LKTITIVARVCNICNNTLVNQRSYNKRVLLTISFMWKEDKTISQQVTNIHYINDYLV
jgi:putative IMPACT (imprinted ancient) family translation regulator